MNEKWIGYDTNTTGCRTHRIIFDKRNGIGVGNITPDVVPSHRQWNIKKAFAEINRKAGLLWHRHHQVLEGLYMNIKTISNRMRQRKAERRIADIKDEAQHRIQIREFGGKLCLAIDNIPVVPIQEDWNAFDVLASCRKTFGEYLTAKKH